MYRAIWFESSSNWTDVGLILVRFQLSYLPHEILLLLFELENLHAITIKRLPSLETNETFVDSNMLNMLILFIYALINKCF